MEDEVVKPSLNFFEVPLENRVYNLKYSIKNLCFKLYRFILKSSCYRLLQAKYFLEMLFWQVIRSFSSYANFGRRNRKAGLKIFLGSVPQDYRVYKLEIFKEPHCFEFYRFVLKSSCYRLLEAKYFLEIIAFIHDLITVSKIPE